VVGAAAAALRSGEPCVLLLGGEGMHRAGLEAASRVAQATGARMLGETFPARHERGAGVPAIDRLAYLAEFAIAQLGDVRHLILAGARAPVSFFAYPGKPSSLVPEGCQVHLLAGGGDDVGGALAALADLVAPGTKPLPQEPARPALPEGDLTGESAAAVIGALLPEGAIVSDEANTSGVWLPAATAGAPPHDWLTLTGGSIGQGLPLATGAAIASPGRSVLALEADGSAMYTISALWTQAREGLDITTVIFSNRAYAILGMELGRVGAAAGGRAAQSLLELSLPAAWAYRPPGRPRQRNSPTSCAGHWPSRARTSSRPSSPRSADHQPDNHRRPRRGFCRLARGRCHFGSRAVTGLPPRRWPRRVARAGRPGPRPASSSRTT
jgi:acetolactate synthase-1/2/3 large subunit